MPSNYPFSTRVHLFLSLTEIVNNQTGERLSIIVTTIVTVAIIVIVVIHIASFVIV